MTGKISRFLALGLMLATAGLARAQALKVGDPAPAIDAMAWLKGAPVTRYAPGHVYVVEFWATWCVPCKENIPHLTALAKKYLDRLTVVGVDVREREMASGSVEKVKAFVTRMGAQMDYTVAMDDPAKNVVFDAWMKAAGMVGIPTAFVVDQAGRISWVGHPKVDDPELEDAVKAALAGSTDYAAMAKKQAAAFAAGQSRRDYTEAHAFIAEALGRQDYAALQASGEKLAADPAPARQELGDQQLFLASIFLAPADAGARVRALYAKASKARVDFTVLLAEYAAMLPRPLIEDVIARLEPLSGRDEMFKHDMQARLYYGLGDGPRAVAALDRYIALVKQDTRMHQGYFDALASKREKYLGAAPR